MRRGDYRLTIVQVALFLLFACWTGLAPQVHAAEGAAYAAALRSITADDLQRHVDVLADDTFEGREAGSRGGRAAGSYLMRLLQKFDLKGAGDNGGYDQSFGADYRNILAYFEGSDPELRNEFVLVGAHYDHVGYGSARNSFGPTGYIHNGADDNASGSAALLEAIEAMASLPSAPRRSVLFAFWDGEEKGLLGSKHWTAQPTVPLSQVKFAMNADMLGRLRNDRIEVYGTRTGRGLRRLITLQNRDLNLLLDFTWEMKSNSDHYPFFQRGIPVVMFHTGLHDDYHRPSDDAHKVNAAGIEQAARLIFNVAVGAADMPQLDGFRSVSRRESPSARRELERATPAPSSRLGVRWDTTRFAEEGIVLTEVVAQSAAARAGLQAGDRLLSVFGREIESEEQFRLEVLAAERELLLSIQRGEQQQPHEITVELDGRPTRLGIAWREDDAEPSAVVLTQITPGSAAHVGGLRVGDRIYEMNGRGYRGSEELKQLATTLPGPLEFLIERQGRLSTVVLHPLEHEDDKAVAADAGATIEATVSEKDAERNASPE